MKKIPSALIFLAMAFTLTLSTGCRTVAVNSHQYLGTTNYPPTDPAQVQILRQEPPQPHLQLGEIRAEPSSDSVGAQKIETALQKAAAQMGANAVVIVQDRTQITGARVTGPWYGRSVQEITGRVIIAVAIRYTGNSK